MFISFERVAISTVVKTVSDLTVPATATHAELQADSSTAGDGVRYTMDGTAPSTTSGMILSANENPKLFLVDDLRRIKFIRRGANDSALLIHYLR